MLRAQEVLCVTDGGKAVGIGPAAGILMPCTWDTGAICSGI